MVTDVTYILRLSNTVNRCKQTTNVDIVKSNSALVKHAGSSNIPIHNFNQNANCMTLFFLFVL